MKLDKIFNMKTLGILMVVVILILLVRPTYQLAPTVDL